jgi:hypothetical protein
MLTCGQRDKFLAILGLSYSEKLTTFEIESGWRRTSARWHPDKLPEPFKGTTEPFQALQEVKNVLIEYMTFGNKKLYGSVKLNTFYLAKRAFELWPPPRVPCCDKADIVAFMKSYTSGNSSNPVDLTDDEEEKHDEERVARIMYTPSTPPPPRKRARRERHPLQLCKGDIIIAKFTGGDELGCIVGSCYGQPWGLKYGTYLVQYEPYPDNGKVSA